VVSTPVKLSNMKVGVRTAAPLRGQHTDEVLASLGYGTDAIAGLRARKVVA
jgi:formyl-CoA transferase